MQYKVLTHNLKVINMTEIKRNIYDVLFSDGRTAKVKKTNNRYVELGNENDFIQNFKCRIEFIEYNETRNLK